MNDTTSPSSVPHLLIVDDDREIRSLLSRYFETNGFHTTAVEHGDAMSAALERSKIDLIVLDVMLPGVNGMTLCRELRRNSQIPVIMLTARGEDEDRIDGLESGADDYLAKPFNPRELQSRVRAVLRRTCAARAGDAPVRTYRFGGWVLDTATRTLTGEDGNIPLSGAEFRLLTVLLASPSRVLSRGQLATLLRGREADPADRSIDVRVSRLRQLLGDNARASQIIKTVYGEGYVIGVGVETA